ncbi:hypothetical protein Tsp_06209 [Trichinella spiralis]|uniref:hypothetical protein n=1 Tax=Trichinella spiralis TaxID=6334 RepID=UPI0001EFB728|nr:hypothetical protein Tsp_06209 [Trichinella spiralis]
MAQEKASFQHARKIRSVICNSSAPKIRLLVTTASRNMRWVQRATMRAQCRFRSAVCRKNTSFPSSQLKIDSGSERTFETLHKNNKKLKLAQSTHSLFTFPRPIASVLCKYQAVFTPDLGCYRGVPVSQNLDPSVVLF